MFGINITDTDITNALGAFFAISGVGAVLIGVIALGLVPLIVKAVLSITGRQ